MNHTLATLIFLLLTATASALPEKHYQDIFAAEIGGRTEVTAGDGTRCDILTDSYAIEVDFARKWGEAIVEFLGTGYSRTCGSYMSIAWRVCCLGY
jgi:hypothetical protein